MGKSTNKLIKKISRGLAKLIKERVSIDARELLAHHNEEGGFTRYDMIVRYLAIENYYGLNSYGFELYEKMQAARKGEDWAAISMCRFKELIKSYENGYDKDSCILLGEDLRLIDGSHRFALALFTKKYIISANVRGFSRLIPCYDIKWFRTNDFSQVDIDIMESKFTELMNLCVTPFVCTLWSPAQKYFNAITQNLAQWGEVVKIRDYELDEFTHNQLVKSIYAIDDIASWKIAKKVDYMRVTSPHGAYKIRVVHLSLPTTSFRLKASNNNTLSTQGEEIKKVIRDAYKGKIENYFHDIILHIGDNYLQNRYMLDLLEYDKLDVNVLFENISNCQYVITKLDTPYMPVDFPKSYPLGKDVDIVCQTSDDFDYICHEVEKRDESFRPYKLRVVNCDKSTWRRRKCRIELNETLIYQFDISHCEGDEFANKMINNRIDRSGYYTPCLSDELIVRIKECMLYPNKKHHLQFVKDNMDAINYDDCEKYLPSKWQEIIK